MSGRLRVEATGETVGEAKWNALRELELLDPLVDKSSVAFEVLSEGQRGLLGVGFEPARVAAVGSARAPRPRADGPEESEEAQRLRALLERVSAALGVECRIEISESPDTLTGTCVGDELGLLIGRYGQTLDALQLLAAAMLRRGGEPRREVVVDAAGYRERRRRRLEELALRSAEHVLESGTRLALEPMSSAERKLVHSYLEHHAGIRTASEGVEPNRHIVVEPA